MWRRIEHTHPAFSVEVPADPQWVAEPDDPDAGSVAAAPDSDHIFVVTWTRANDAWVSVQCAAITGGRTVLENVAISASEARVVVERDLGYVQTVRVIVRDGVGYMVIATTRSREDADAARFLSSFSARAAVTSS